MAIRVKTPTPAKLLTSIKSAIDKKKIDTWTYNKAGDFTHSPPQWSEKAWLRPSVEGGELVLRVQTGSVTLTASIYGIFHGRFAEMLLSHFASDFTSVELIPPITS